MRQVEQNVGVAPAASPLALAARLGLEACGGLEAGSRSGMGQFLTPPGVAGLLAGMFEVAEEDVRLLDLGAGVGALTAAFTEDVLGRKRKPRSLHLTAWEAEGAFIGLLESVLEECVEAGRAAGVPTSYVVNHGDALRGGLESLPEDDLFTGAWRGRGFTHAILNPPYRKINVDSEARWLLRRAGLETSNLYTGFLWLAARLLEPNGQMVAITPRSFCNGPYFLPFRERFFGLMALERLHVFDKRDALFSGDDVLQENVIMHARRGTKRHASIVLSSSSGLPSEIGRARTVPYSRVFDPADAGQVIHLALDAVDDEVRAAVMRLPAKLSDLGVGVSTGRVVDFRARSFLRKEPEEGTVPLIYPLHFNGGCVHWPSVGSRKANALLAVPETGDLVVPNGFYVLLKRFTAKEERRRVVATVFRPEGRLASFQWVGFENHLNYFHHGGKGLEERLAEGLAVYLNSTMVDSYFRQFSGHTQVNATDLRGLRYPSVGQLYGLAASGAAGTGDQGAIDAAVAAMIRTSQR